MSDKLMVICGDQNYGNSVARKAICSICASEVYVSPSSDKLAKQKKRDLQIFCIDCGLQRKANLVLEVNEEQRQECYEAGLSSQDVEKAINFLKWHVLKS